jgi:hypothetical protein
MEHPCPTRARRLGIFICCKPDLINHKPSATILSERAAVTFQQLYKDKIVKGRLKQAFHEQNLWRHSPMALRNGDNSDSLGN